MESLLGKNGSRVQYPMTWIFKFPAALGPGVYSASNRNEYQKNKFNVSGE
jgi:hypothetical protein